MHILRYHGPTSTSTSSTAASLHRTVGNRRGAGPKSRSPFGAARPVDHRLLSILTGRLIYMPPTVLSMQCMRVARGHVEWTRDYREICHRARLRVVVNPMLVRVRSSAAAQASAARCWRNSTTTPKATARRLIHGLHGSDRVRNTNMHLIISIRLPAQSIRVKGVVKRSHCAASLIANAVSDALRTFASIQSVTRNQAYPAGIASRHAP